MTPRGDDVRLRDTRPAGDAATASPLSRADGSPARQGSLRRRTFLEAGSVVVVIVAITAYLQIGPRRGGAPPNPVADGKAVAAVPPAPVAPAATVATAPPETAEPEPAPAPAPEPDRAKIAAATAALEAASADRARADAREAEAAKRLARAVNQSALDTLTARKIAFQVRDPSTRIAQAAARGGFLKGERDRLAKEVATLRSIPQPKSVSILSKSPVARPVAEDEYHFELRHNRITFIDLDKLIQLTRADAQMRVRMTDRPGSISNKVGPVGAFSLAYEVAPISNADLEGVIERRSVRHYELQEWELVPEADLRGETYEASRNPISDFNRAVNRFNPNRATITLWVYPDSFGLYRRVRSDLMERGFSVAARPLPNGLGIRGSPRGSQSAAQ